MDFMEMRHGGDWAAYQREYGDLPLDFSASVSPLGLPERVRIAAEKTLARADRYPDPLCLALRERLSGRCGVPVSRVVCGGGAADLIWRLCLALRPRRAALFVPCFSEYARALRAVDCEITRVLLPASDGFRLTDHSVRQLPPELDLVFLCSPNNPTGLVPDRALLLDLLAYCRERGAVLALDECFLDLCAQAESRTLLGELETGPGLVILRAFTKTYAMAGLRLGCALCASDTLAAGLLAAGQPWPVTEAAQAAGIAALEEKDYVNQLRALIAAERPRVLARLEALGLRVIPGEANFLLFSSADTGLAEKLRARGVLIRSCADFDGLGASWYRVAIRTAAENDTLLKALGEVLHG